MVSDHQFQRVIPEQRNQITAVRLANQQVNIRWSLTQPATIGDGGTGDI